MSKVATVTVRTRPGKEEEAIKALTQIVNYSRSEKGCLDYHIVQSSDDPRNFMAFMIYESEEDFNRHKSDKFLVKIREEQFPTLMEEGPDFKDWRDLA